MFDFRVHHVGTVSYMIKFTPKIDRKQVSKGDARFLQFLRVVSADYGKPRIFVSLLMSHILKLKLGRVLRLFSRKIISRREE